MNRFRYLNPSDYQMRVLRMSGCAMFGFAREETIIQVNAEGPWAINFINPADDLRKK
jgi:hypothetical protein